jgi:hypothetical protein
MNKPYPGKPEPIDPKKDGKIKILYTKKTANSVDLYIGADRLKPKLIHKFPAGTIVHGICHNHGRKDKYAIGVVATKKRI